MAQQIQIICDVCMGKDTESEASLYEIEIGGVKRAIDLCDEDADDLVIRLQTVLKELGRPVGAPGIVTRSPHSAPRTSVNTPRGELAQTCPVKACEWGTMSETRDMLRNHVRREHGVDLRAIEQYGVGPALAGVGAKYLCDLRGCSNKFLDRNSFMVHLRSGHDMPTKEKAQQYADTRRVADADQRELFHQYGEGNKHGDKS